jgi:hypothetical protein
MRDFELERAGEGPAARRSIDGATRDGAAGSPVIARSPALDAAGVMHLQRTAGNQSVVQLLGADDEERSPVHDVVGSGGGAPLPGDTRAGMESAFGTSFEHVRVHTDDKASRSAESVGANAYTVGSDIVFRGGQFNPSSSTGQRTIAHELAHVVQQSQGPVDGADAGGGIRLSNPSDRFEQAAEDTADEVMSSPVQREVAPEEEEELPA